MMNAAFKRNMIIAAWAIAGLFIPLFRYSFAAKALITARRPDCDGWCTLGMAILGSAIEIGIALVLIPLCFAVAGLFFGGEARIKAAALSFLVSFLTMGLSLIVGYHLL